MQFKLIKDDYNAIKLCFDEYFVSKYGKIFNGILNILKYSDNVKNQDLI